MKPVFEWLSEFCIGWRWRRAMLLDNCGLPLWFIRRRCPATAGWGAMLDILVSAIDPGMCSQ